ncbi:MAG: hypothetical protein HY335_01025 [Deinococcus sp.]|nr:hypothetical protein [Deinococcus sp.]
MLPPLSPTEACTVVLLALVLTACPGGGPGLSFAGTYSGTFAGFRDVAQLPEAWRGMTVTADLTQTGSNVSGSVTGLGPSTATITAMVTTPGEATGTHAFGNMSFPVNLFLTANQDLVLHFPTVGGTALFLERQT